MRQKVGPDHPGPNADPGANSTHPDWAFRVHLPTYSGDLSGLATRLRTGEIAPAQVPLLRLTRELLAWAGDFAALHPESYAELLPGLGSVIALKARLLLPAPEREPQPGDGEDWDVEPEASVLEGVQALEQLGELVRLLAERRQAREGLIPAGRIELGLPRRPSRASGKQGLARLVRAAQQAVREVAVPLLSVERLTLQDALKALRALARRLNSFTFGSLFTSETVPAQDWGERSTYFSALLEGVKAGDFMVKQEEMYGEIVVARAGAEAELK